MKKLVLWSIGIAYFLPALVSAAINEEGLQKAIVEIEAEAKAILQAEKTSAAAIAITYKGEVLYTKSLGTMSNDNQKATDLNSYFRIASGSKMFTAIAINHLAEAGVIALDAPIVTYLPWFRLSDGNEEAANKITVRQLLNHTSGISRELGCPAMDEKGNWFAGLDLAYCVSRQETVFAPGTKLKYSNLGYVLLGQIIAEKGGASGRTNDEKYMNYMTKKVLLPLGMKGAKYTLNAQEIKRLTQPLGFVDAATGQREAFQKVSSTYFNAPAWGLALNTTHLPQALKFLYNMISGAPNGVMKTETATSMIASPIRDGATTSSHALGFGMTHDANGNNRRIGHSGNFPGYTTLIFVDEATGVGVAVIANTHERKPATGISNLIFKKMIDLVNPPIVAPAAPVAAAKPANPAAAPVVASIDTTESELIGKFSGWARRGMEFKFENGALIAIIDGAPQALTRVSETEYRLPLAAPYSGHAGERIEFQTKPDGKIDTMILSRGYIYKRSQ